MPKTTATITIDWTVSEGTPPPAAVVKRIFTERLREYAESLDFSGELTNEILNERRMDGYMEVQSASAKKNPSSPEEKARRRGRVAKGRKKKAKSRKKRSRAMQRALRGT